MNPEVEVLRREIIRVLQEVMKDVSYPELRRVLGDIASRLARAAHLTGERPIPYPEQRPIQRLPDSQDISYREPGPELGHAQTLREELLMAAEGCRLTANSLVHQVIDRRLPAGGPPPPNELKPLEKLICDAIGDIVLYGRGGEYLKRWSAQVKL